MSTTKPLTFPLSDNYVCLETNSPLANGVVIPFGTPAVLDFADGKVKPATKALLVAGAALLGIALDTWDNADNKYSTTGPRQLYARNCQWQAPNNSNGGGSLVTIVGQLATIQDNNSVTIGGGVGDQNFRSDALPAEGGVVIWIP